MRGFALGGSAARDCQDRLIVSARGMKGIMPTGDDRIGMSFISERNLLREAQDDFCYTRVRTLLVHKPDIHARRVKLEAPVIQAFSACRPRHFDAACLE